MVRVTITICLRAFSFNITIVQAYAPTSDYDDNEIEEFYDQLQNVIDQTPKKNILVVQGGWNAKVGRDACGNWQGTFGHHRASRRWTWHSPNGQPHNQINYILVKKRF